MEITFNISLVNPNLDSSPLTHFCHVAPSAENAWGFSPKGLSMADYAYLYFSLILKSRIEVGSY
jgi:hypothetical protein